MNVTLYLIESVECHNHRVMRVRDAVVAGCMRLQCRVWLWPGMLGRGGLGVAHEDGPLEPISSPYDFAPHGWDS
jgi:hypothetical protein